MNASDFLLQSQNPDGGWGYRVRARSVSYVEPTCAVTLALPDSDARARGRDFLLSLQHSDGGWGIAAIDSESGWMTTWAVRALADFADAREAVSRGVNWLIATEGLRVTDDANRTKVSEMFKIDSTLRGWPWQRNDAAWVHPTALAVLALRQAQGRLVGNSKEFILSEVEGRVREGVAYLFDRATPSGGWNIGNPWMLDKQIPATIQDTAVVLLALRAVNIGSDEPRVTQAIEYLRGAVARAKTPAELAWGIYALRNWNVDAGDALVRLNALQGADGSWSGNPFITAIAMPASQK